MNKPAAIYARVSSDRQKENHTIASQTEALKEFARTHSYAVPPEWVFQDEGYSGATPEDQLLVQFQGMIAEYERAQIAERSRRGKRHKAQQGVINVLSGAPYGYRYVKKNDHSAAYYEVIDHEAQVVQMV